MGRYLSILQIRFRSDMQAGTIDLLMTRVTRKHLPSAIRYTLMKAYQFGNVSNAKERKPSG